MIVFILSLFKNPGLVQTDFRRYSDFYTKTRTVLLYQFGEEVGSSNLVLVDYILKLTQQPKDHPRYFHVIPKYIPLCKDTPIFVIVLYDGIKHVGVNRK